MDKAELFRKLNDGILDERIDIFRRNLHRNLPLIKSCGGLKDVVPLFNGVDLIIAGAGSSIDLVMDDLKKAVLMEKVVLLCADMAYLPLVSRGIAPDFVITCESTPRAYFDFCDTSKSHLLAFSCSRHSNIRNWNGSMSFFNWMIKGIYEELWSEAGTTLGYLATGSTVITQAISLALGCAVKSLCVIGNDLAYRDRYYANGTEWSVRNNAQACRVKNADTFQYNAVRSARQFNIVRGDNNYYYTHPQFLAAKYWLEDLFRKSALTLIDCSVPGCAGENILNTGFDRYLKYLGERW